MHMRTLLAVTATSLIGFMAPVAAQTCAVDQKDDIRRSVECQEGEGIGFVLDYSRGSGGRPLMALSFVSRSQACQAGETTYRLEGFPGVYRSPADIRRAIAAYRTLIELKVLLSEFVPSVDYLRKLDAAARGEAEAAKKK